MTHDTVGDAQGQAWSLHDGVGRSLRTGPSSDREAGGRARRSAILTMS
jgi:hypothetical protein